MFLIETHLHTSEVSACGHVRAAEMIRRYKEAGYSTVCVTDHCMLSVFNNLGDIPWEEKTAIYLSGFYRAKKAGEDLGVNVILAPEFHFLNSPNDYVVYGVDKAFLDAHPELPDMTIEEFYPLAKENGLFVVQAHPHRDGVCYPTPDYTDGVEVYNSNPRHDDYSEKTAAIAEKYSLPVTAGSDAHQLCDIGLAGLVSDYEIKTSSQLVELIKSGRARIYRKDATE